MILEKPICIFDIESTGVSTSTDRIVQIAVIKLLPNGTKEEKEVLINPEIPIPQESTEVHGITDDMVKDAPTFKQLSKSINEFFEGCDIGGFNSDSFDINILMAEMNRAEVEFSTKGRNFVDVLKLYRQLFPSTLEAIYERLTGESLEGAHDALADTRATLTVLEKILPEELKTPKDIDEFCQGDKKRVDIASKLYEDGERVVRYNFGKDRDKSVVSEPGFANWMLRQDFPEDTKNKIREILKNG